MTSYIIQSIIALMVFIFGSVLLKITTDDFRIKYPKNKGIIHLAAIALFILLLMVVAVIISSNAHKVYMISTAENRVEMDISIKAKSEKASIDKSIQKMNIYRRQLNMCDLVLVEDNRLGMDGWCIYYSRNSPQDTDVYFEKSDVNGNEANIYFDDDEHIWYAAIILATGKGSMDCKKFSKLKDAFNYCNTKLKEASSN